jgi:hypothetical protein
MGQPIEFGEAFRPRLTVDGLRNLIGDLRRSGGQLPGAILVSEYDRRDLNQDLLAGSATPVAKADQAPEHDRECIGVIEGIPIMAHPEIARGKARLVYPQTKAPVNRPGTGKIILA